MKGKTGKPSAMRGGGIARKGVGAALKGGGLARKGVGMALKGGGIARKGTGSDAEPGGKKMAMGGMSAKALPPRLGGSPNPQSDTPNLGPKGSLAGYAAQNYGGPRGPRGNPGMVRPGFPVKPGTGRPGAGTMPQGMDPREIQTLASLGNTPGNVTAADLAGRPPKLATPPSNYDPGYKKDGGKVSKYAKGGAVKMTAGAGSGSGRLEKVAAHKAAKRVPATGLKGGGLSKLLTQLSPAAMLIKGEMPKMGLLGMGLDAIKGRKDQEGSGEGRSPDQVKKELGLKKGGKVKRK